jgi:sulfonate transport system ATP-binding protein
MQRLLEQVWLDRGFDALLVTCDVADAAMLADRMLVIEEGRPKADVQVRAARRSMARGACEDRNVMR